MRTVITAPSSRTQLAGAWSRWALAEESAGEHAQVDDAVFITIDDLDDGDGRATAAITNAPGTIREGSTAALASVHGRPVSSIVFQSTSMSIV